MDPVTAVGLVVSMVQLSGTAKAILCPLIQYYDAVKNAPKRSKELRKELHALCDIIEQLEDVVTTNTLFEGSTPLRESIADFHSMLNEMSERVKPSKTKGVGLLKWPFTKEENDRLLERISRYKSTFNLALSLQTTQSPRHNDLD